MDTSFEVKVTDITRREFLSATRWLKMRKTLAMLAIFAVIFVVLPFTEYTSLQMQLLILAVMVIIVAYQEITHLTDFKKFPKTLELRYEMDSHGWRLRVGDDSAVCAWANTVKLVDTKQLFLIYPNKKASNLLPKRCLTEEQIQLIRSWYKNRFNLPPLADEDE